MNQQQRGFTLAEVLVALALLALLATMSWRGVSSMAEAKQSADARVNETLRLGTVLAQWEKERQWRFFHWHASPATSPLPAPKVEK